MNPSPPQTPVREAAAWRARPLLLFSFGMAAAVAAANLLPFLWPLWAGFVLFALAAALFFLRKRLRHNTLLLLAFSLAAGLLLRGGYDYVRVAPLSVWDGTAMETQFHVSAYPEPARYGYKVTGTLTLPDGGQVKTLLYASGEDDFAPGDTLDVRGMLHAPLPGSTDDSLRTLRPKGVFATFSAKEAVVSANQPGPRLGDHLAVASRAFKTRLYELLDPPNAALSIALLAGDTSDLSVSLDIALADTGLAHAVSVSGLHVAFLVGFLLCIPGLRRRPLLAFCVCVPVIIAFIALAGFPASAIRAGIMQSMLLLAAVLSRDYDPLTALGVSLSAILLVNPYALGGIGLQLSFASVLGILLFAGRWNASFMRWLDTRCGNYLVRSLILFAVRALFVSCAALLFTLPLCAVYFGSVSLVSPLANLLTLGLISVIFIGSIALTAAAFIVPPVAPILAVPLGWLLSLFTKAVTALRAFPLAAVKTSDPLMILWLVFAYLLLWLTLYKRPARWRERLLPPALAAAGLVFVLLLNTLMRPALEIVVLDVGQGQCILLMTPNQTAVIDCGGSPNAARRAVDFLQSRGRRHIDLLALTHLHTDHAEGVPDLLGTLPVSHLLLPPEEEDTQTLRTHILQAASVNRVPVSEVSSLRQWPLDSASLTVIPPVGLQDANERCVSFVCTLNDFDMLVTGDMPAATERALLRAVDLPDVEVLVAGHHGSRYSTSEAFLDALQPQTAFISVSAYNTYGHPHPDTLGRLYDAGATIYRTDREGNLIIQVAN